MAISTYIRERLGAADDRSEELAGIRDALVELGDTVDELRAQGGGNRQIEARQDGPSTVEPNAVQIETLMLLRAIASSEKLRMIRGELDRQGIESWQGPVR
ncbi:hypothetical protein [Sphingomonas carotinifaciens]|uniref:hypothetical protein n=1 Tax=Sphingomonas carotinifaciens TaxID=1166323 RepID=UPI001374C575|nr:hypothetical protein [Sphingomonas carotinifaciens]